MQVLDNINRLDEYSSEGRAWLAAATQRGAVRPHMLRVWYGLG